MVFSSTAPMVLVYVAFSTSTVLPTGRDPAGPLVGLSVARPGDVEDLLEALTVLRPALHDLDAVEVAGGRVFHCPHQERRGLGLRRRQVAPHRNALRVARLDPILVGHHGRGVLPPAEEAHLDVRAGHREGLLALHALEQGGSGVLLGPHAGQSAGALGARVEKPADQSAGHARLDRPVRERMAAEEVVLAVRDGGVVRVRRGPETELVRVEALAVLQGEAVLERLAGVAADDVRHAAGRVAEQNRHDLEVREFVARGQRWGGSRKCPSAA